jgi:hypothetical protein
MPGYGSAVSTSQVAHLQFSGPAGSWQIIQTAKMPRGSLSILLPANDETLGRVLIMLSGGTLELKKPSSRSLSVQLPAAGSDGRSWFDCARDKLL